MSHTYGASGTYTASLRVSDSRGATSAPATVMISVGTNTPPSASIVSPAEGATFTVGQTLTLTGSGTDAQDGTLGAEAMTWEVRRHHNGSHWHPWFSGTGNNLTFQAPPPEDLQATGTGNHLEILLTVRDSGGLTTTVTRIVQPRRVTLTFTTNPQGLNVTVTGVTLQGPTNITSWEGWALSVDAPSPQGAYVFKSWSDGGAKAHTIVTPASGTVYTARFKRSRGGFALNRGLLLG
jgi:PKD repeat protein